MKHPFTTTLTTSTLQFLISEAKKLKKNKNEILEEAVKIYKREKLKIEVEEGMRDRQSEDRKIAKEFQEAQFDLLSKL